MIVFFNKNSGKIVGTINGRIHSENDKTFIGSPDKNEKLVINWIKNKNNIYEPNVSEDQKEIAIAIDKKAMLIYDYYVDTTTKKMIKKIQ